MTKVVAESRGGGSGVSERQVNDGDPDTMVKEPRRSSNNGNYESLSNDVEAVHGTVDEDGRVRVDRSMSLESMARMGRRLLDVLSITDNDIQKQKGIDAVQYLTFQRYIIYFLLLLTAICLIIILPINLQGNLRELFSGLFFSFSLCVSLSLFSTCTDHVRKSISFLFPSSQSLRWIQQAICTNNRVQPGNIIRSVMGSCFDIDRSSSDRNPDDVSLFEDNQECE